MVDTILDSFLLSQIFGLYCVILAIIMLSRAVFYRNLIAHMDLKYGTFIVASLFGLLLGLLLVGMHNVWVFKPRVLITLFCWFILVNSILWLSMPERMLVQLKRLYSGKGYYILYSVILALGCTLISRGVFLYVEFMVHHGH
jgi:hypothetical protein